MCCAARRESVKNEIYLSNFCNYPTAFLSCAAFHQRIEKHKQFNNDRWFLLPIVVTQTNTDENEKSDCNSPDIPCTGRQYYIEYLQSAHS